MNENPTSLCVGATGKLSNLRFRVIGRVVMGVEEGGETYTWQEFNLLDDDGRTATLVFEDGEWKLFMLFDPVQPMTAAEAARKRVGDIVNLDGRPVEITLVGQSRVYHIEGRAPEGVELGDVANYFNADTGIEMLVVSWTGDEVEFYRGVDIPAEDVAAAFNIQTFTPPANAHAAYAEEEEAPQSSGIIGKLVVVGVLLTVLGSFARPLLSNRFRSSSAPRKIETKAPTLRVGSVGSLAGKSCSLVGCAKMEIARTGSRYDCYEYHLSTGELLVAGLDAGSDKWLLFHAAQPDGPLAQWQAAQLRRGDVVNLDGHALWVQDMFQSRILSTEGQLPAIPGMFGVLARSTNEWAIVRWTETAMEFYLGAPVDGKNVLSSFVSSPK